MVSWQIKGLLLLASALVAITLVASTSGAMPQRRGTGGGQPLPARATTAVPRRMLRRSYRIVRVLA